MEEWIKVTIIFKYTHLHFITREYQQATFQIGHIEMQDKNFVRKKVGTTQVTYCSKSLKSW